MEFLYGFLLGATIVLFVVWIIYRFFGFGVQYEPADLEALIESQGEYKKDCCKRILEVICNMCDVQENELESKSYAVDIDKLLMTVGFRDVSFSILMDFNLFKYTLTAYRFLENNEVVVHKKTFKLEDSDVVDYKKLISFIDKFESTEKITYEELIEELREVANSEELANFTPQQKQEMLYRGLAYFDLAMRKRRIRNNYHATLSYSMLMAYIAHSDKKQDFENFLTQTTTTTAVASEEE